MKTFLDQLAQEVLSKQTSDFSELCIVLPNRRAGVFLRDALSKIADRAIWAPKILSIEDFVFELSDYVKIDQTTLLFAFYEVYKKKVKDPQSLEKFANWAPTFLADINEVDINLVDAKDIFYQLTSIERISKWNPSGSPITEFQQKHIDFVESFYELYQNLRSEIEAEKKAYQGMAFRQVAENSAITLNNCPWKKVWFAGFNALTVSEEEIINVFLQVERARIFWDMDEYYSNDPIHEAGFYLRKYKEGKGRLKVDSEFDWQQDLFKSQPKEIHLIAAQRSVAQAEAASSILSEKCQSSGEKTLSNTAVVLNDEKLLLPLLNTMPLELTGVNITMGYGLQYSQSAAFVNKLFQLYINSNKSADHYYHKDLLSVLTDGIYLSVSERDPGQLRDFVLKQNKAYVNASALATTKFDELLFGHKSDSVGDFLTYLRAVAAFIQEKGSGSAYVLESKFLALIVRMTIRLSDLQMEYGGIQSLKTLQIFWRQLVNNQSLDFVGEPLGGLQIMGMLETRNLDFEELIILGVNEGSLPSNAHSSSNFTFDVRRAFGLACQNERDAVTAYHFYRLIQRAKKVYLIYDQDTTSFGGGEVSRYVQQLEMEAPKNISIKLWGLEQKLPKAKSGTEITIEKGKREFEKLLSLAERGFSPSALNTYRSCQLKFYFKYVAGFKEADSVDESVDHATFGTAVHDTLEALYEPHIGKPLTVEVLNGLKSKSEKELQLQFAKQISGDGLIHGKNLLAYEVAKTYVSRVLNLDLNSVKAGKAITPLLLEEQLKRSVTLTIGEEEIEIGLKGMADRIDQLADGTIRIIDYKTGAFDQKKTSVKLDDTLASPAADHAFQLLLYAYMYKGQQQNAAPLQPTVFYLRSKEIEKPILVLDQKVPESTEAVLEFAENQVVALLGEMMDTSISFTQTTSESTCEYCDFRAVCQR